VIVVLAIDHIKGLNLFDIFQSVLGFIAPPLSVVFLLTVFWKRMSRKAVNFTLSVGSALSLATGITYLWILPPDQYLFWPHYLMLSFLIFLGLLIIAVIISLTDRQPHTYVSTSLVAVEKPSGRVWIAWTALAMVMVFLYIFFNGH
jgi:SSS family solute:Na+ symporter